ncbi:MAG TPA: 30S ribosome-binding factor RbfA [Candidatus Omnitrophica bacterium]|nr:30S ribosome-binding factor RbfA [Candidatus Omnitrophota bacterium]
MSRVDRVAQEIKKLVSEIMLFEVKDARIGFITVTHVKVTNDLKLAKVYYTVLGDDQQRKQAKDGLESAVKFIRQLVASRINMRFAPEIAFYFDDTLDRSIKVEEILDNIKNEDEDRDQKDDTKP